MNGEDRVKGWKVCFRRWWRKSN